MVMVPERCRRWQCVTEGDVQHDGAGDGSVLQMVMVPERCRRWQCVTDGDVQHGAGDEDG
jgi:hypothetical protein